MVDSDGLPIVANQLLSHFVEELVDGDALLRWHLLMVDLVAFGLLNALFPVLWAQIDFVSHQEYALFGDILL